MKQAGLTTSLDTNDDPDNLWASDVEAVLKNVDVFLPNEREACKVAGTSDVENALNVLSRRVPIVVIKCGGQGVLAKRGNERFYAASLAVQPIDTVGAGDTFNAGFLHKFIHGSDLQDCLQYGNVTAALSTTRAGGTEAFRDREHRERFLRGCGKA
jgi:sugar/nucleoside kinase (ribokinase family)